MSKRIGYLTSTKNGLVVLCDGCANNLQPRSPIYEENIKPYKQSCACCSKILVEPETPAWCELYDGKKASDKFS